MKLGLIKGKWTLRFSCKLFRIACAGHKIMASQQIMSGQKGNLTGQELHLLVMLTGHTHTLILEQTANSSHVHLKFCLNDHVHEQKITQGSVDFFTIIFDWSEKGLDQAKVTMAPLVMMSHRHPKIILSPDVYDKIFVVGKGTG